jgi:hypothetical protein
MVQTRSSARQHTSDDEDDTAAASRTPLLAGQQQQQHTRTPTGRSAARGSQQQQHDTQQQQQQQQQQHNQQQQQQPHDKGQVFHKGVAISMWQNSGDEDSNWTHFIKSKFPFAALPFGGNRFSGTHSVLEACPDTWNRCVCGLVVL